MDLTGKIFAAHRILRDARCPVSRAALQARLECSRATTARVLAKLRDQLRAPVEYDRTAGGYRYAKTQDGPFELHGLWFNASELHSLLAAHQLLAQAQPGLLEKDLAPLLARIEPHVFTRKDLEEEDPVISEILRTGRRID